ncbi:hypothetical protein [Demequina activiva]|uniref:Uncharacterized protein n=1 Tax=Demequina activiva TaxID=1582364 RepID=A0A919Q529_9MICO|nr:hypothetical protein [Demequina activiva]GIG53990.1 hypothetical protein Dac01nite_07420 [Demequina activiva]
MRRRTALWTGFGIVVLAAGLVAAILVSARLEASQRLDPERVIAQQYLDIDGATSVTTSETLGALFPDGLGSGIGSVYVHYETEDSDAVLAALEQQLEEDGWRREGDGSTWSGGAAHDSRWATVSTRDGEVWLRIGSIEG